MKHTLTIVAPLLALAFAANAQDTTQGWLIRGDSPTLSNHAYTEPSYWVDGIVNGVFDQSLVLTNNLTILIDDNIVLDHGWQFAFSGNKNVTFTSGGGGTKTITLGGNVYHSTTGGVVYVGNATAANNLDVNLGGEHRFFQIRNGRELRLYGGVSNGGLTAKNSGLIFVQANSTTPVNQLTELKIGNINFSGNAYARFNISGALVADGTSEGRMHQGNSTGGIGFWTINANQSGFATTMNAGSFRRDGGGLLNIRGPRIGAAAPGSQRANIFFDNPPAMIGGGGTAETHDISIIPGLFTGAATDSAPDMFVTYDEFGLRGLNATTEFTNALPVGEVTALNVRLPAHTATTNDFDTTINSLMMVAGGNSNPKITLSGTGVLHIASGMVHFNSGNGGQILSCPLDFKDKQGILIGSNGKGSTVQSPIHGSGGLVLAQVRGGPNSDTSSGGTPTTFSGGILQSTFTGDVHIFNRVAVSGSTFFPQGSRTGDMYIQGVLTFTGTAATFNGLNGVGKLNRTNSGSQYVFTVGDNDADGDFDGWITDEGGANQGFSKIGAGTQRLGGNSNYRNATTVNAGTLIIDGSIASATTVKSGATLRGAGTINRRASGNANPIAMLTVENGALFAPGNAQGLGTFSVATNNVALHDGAEMEFTVGNDGAGTLELLGGSVTGFFEIPLKIKGEGHGKWLVMSVPEGNVIEPTFPYCPGYKITKEANDTQLWILRRPPPSTLIVR